VGFGVEPDHDTLLGGAGGHGGHPYMGPGGASGASGVVIVGDSTVAPPESQGEQLAPTPAEPNRSRTDGGLREVNAV
jgi:hypothetical protein